MSGARTSAAQAGSGILLARRRTVSTARPCGWPGVVHLAQADTAPLDRVHVGHFAAEADMDRDAGGRVASGRAVGRFWVTVAVDACSLMVAGISFSLGKPDAAAVAECLEAAMEPKEALLAEHAVIGDWPAAGQVGEALLDGGPGASDPGLARFCREHGIRLPAAEPALQSATHPGAASVERVARYVTARIPRAPGQAVTGRALAGAQARRSPAFGNHRALVLDIVVNGYHLAPHPALGMSPLERWEQAVQGRLAYPDAAAAA